MIRDTLSVEAGDVRLAVYVSGPRDAPPIVLVHGYPDSAAVWEPVRAQLDARYRVISYDVRGAGASDAPESRAAYRLERLAADLAAVADATCGARPFHLVGHDWGSIQSWEAVTDPVFKGRVASYTSISGPCLDHASFGLRGAGAGADRAEQSDAHHAAKRPFGSGLRQTLKSWYIFFFHLPLLPELVWRAGGARMWPLWLRLTERVRLERDPAQMRNAINGLNLYRANFIDKLLRPRARHAHAPVQFIVPLRDRYVGPELSIGLEGWLGPYSRTEIDAGHWVVLREPERIATAIERFVEQHRVQQPADNGGPGASTVNARAAGA
ncbi:alpha/beta fold hydrolase [Paraburkholderia madseniana]|uniref:Alpha/beta fold hydrolase n=1 Tax=Paraburkholderia madseniana TaxID=2599607 RepID=A0AAP5BD41_9BURK|nr:MULTISPECIES: alpha/beta fold hydrolase [Paraburkholderia]MCX4147285.1 alpha/beta fold hydrolase [Paraburkholderia madseniana]MDN7150228.1 alpha/beta fold hydrolase [Paraburkholderia sp. WS6]MDQ6409108.1 alpha/beta fold hydrolase [Paraburkholderia madseniana]